LLVAEGTVAGNARKETEKELGKSVISRDNHLLLQDDSEDNADEL
jgi:hypothetical protein